MNLSQIEQEFLRLVAAISREEIVTNKKAKFQIQKILDLLWDLKHKNTETL